MQPSTFDAELSARLNEVPLPADLHARLRSIPAASDADLDAVLCDVALPPGLAMRLAAAASASSDRWPAKLRQAAAAVVLFALGLGYIFSVIAFVASRFDQPVMAGELLKSAWSLTPNEADLDQAWITLDSELEPAVESDSSLRSTALDSRARAIEGDAAELPALDLIAYVEDGECAPPQSPSTQFEELSAWSERSTIRLSDRGDWDLLFWRQTGLLPWFNTNSDLSFEVTLAGDDESYRSCVRSIRSGWLPRAAGVRSEEFLAAFDFGLSAVNHSGPAVILAAGPSSFGVGLGNRNPSPPGSRRWLVMVGVALPGIDAPKMLIDLVPDRMKACRIIGYGPASNTADGSLPRPMAIDASAVAASESWVVLFEIELAGEASPSFPLAAVRLEWHDDTGHVQTAESTLNGRCFSPDFEAAPVAWRQAALVALAAECLARSPFAEQVSLADVADAAREIEPLVSDRAGWREFTEMVIRAQSLRSSLLRAF